MPVPPLDDTAAVWSLPAERREGRPLLVALHGYGGHEGDMVDLVPDLPAEYATVALRAPIARERGYTWFRVRGSSGDPSSADVAPAADAVLDWIDAHRGSAPFVGLLGHSQGGAVALQGLRRRPSGLAFVVTLAGFVATGRESGDEELETLRPPVFWGRGARDDVVFGADIDRMAAFLPARSTLTRREYPELDHGISKEELADTAAFLRAQLPPQPSGG